MPFRILPPTAPSVSLVLASPHSGRTYPPDFGFTCPLPLLRHDEDAYVDELIQEATATGATVMLANFPRSYIDPNRPEDDIDPSSLAAPWHDTLNPTPQTCQRGHGLVRFRGRKGTPIYQTPLAPEVIRSRLESCYRPYHQALGHLLDEQKQLNGFVWFLDCHSMPSTRLDGATRTEDFILGDLDGHSCASALTEKVGTILQSLGYCVAVNNPFRGAEILRRHGKPKQGSHALQIEINRSLYMDEATLEKHDGALPLCRNLNILFTELAKSLREG